MVHTTGDATTGTYPGSWTAVQLDSAPLYTLSCPTTSLCVAGGASGRLFTTTSPTTGGNVWTSFQALNSPLAAVSCPTSSQCVAVDGYGDVLASANPSGSGPAWGFETIDNTLLLTEVSCLSSGLCVALDRHGFEVAGTFAPGYEAVGGAATSISVGASGAVWVVGTNHTGGGYGIYYLAETGWVGVSGGAVAIAVDSAGRPWVVNSAHRIFHWTGTGWTPYPGAAIDIGVGANGAALGRGNQPHVRWLRDLPLERKGLGRGQRWGGRNRGGLSWPALGGQLRRPDLSLDRYGLDPLSGGGHRYWRWRQRRGLGRGNQPPTRRKWCLPLVRQRLGRHAGSGGRYCCRQHR